MYIEQTYVYVDRQTHESPKTIDSAAIGNGPEKKMIQTAINKY